MSQVPNSFRYNSELLENFSKAALNNAKELIEEAQLLLDHGHLCRAYFIAVAAIEEIGKSFIAFDAQGRNLSDSAVTAKLRNSLESHPSKISSAFQASILSHGDLEKELKGIIELMIELKDGREPSMYTDINYSTSEIKRPRDVVREIAAKDCLRLAQHCYYKTEEHQKTKPPLQRSKHEDIFYGMKKKDLNKLFNNEDFWWFFIANMERDDKDFSKSAVVYQREYLSKGKKFKAAEKLNNDTQ
jgi:AbiV family abortive infection protein